VKVIAQFGFISLMLGLAVGLTDCAPVRQARRRRRRAVILRRRISRPQTLLRLRRSRLHLRHLLRTMRLPRLPHRLMTRVIRHPPARPLLRRSYTEDDQQYAQDQQAFDDQPIVTNQPPPPLRIIRSLLAPVKTTSGRPAIGPIPTMATTGRQAHGSCPWSELFGPALLAFYEGHYRLNHGYWDRISASMRCKLWLRIYRPGYEGGIGTEDV